MNDVVEITYLNDHDRYLIELDSGDTIEVTQQQLNEAKCGSNNIRNV
jgi:hypothetical protein